MYAELVQNRDFEYAPEDKTGNDPDWNSRYAWELKSYKADAPAEPIVLEIDTAAPLHPNNPHYAVLHAQSTELDLINRGFDGIHIRKGEKYNLSFFSRIQGKGQGTLQVQLRNRSGKPLAQAAVKVAPGEWTKQHLTLQAVEDADSASLSIQTVTPGIYALDMISLFPQKTFKNRPNGLRADLAQTIADLYPRFMRFPGGCLAHGDGVHNIYNWKETIGPLESRKPQRNLWGYHQTKGLGYYEFSSSAKIFRQNLFLLLPRAYVVRTPVEAGSRESRCAIWMLLSKTSWIWWNMRMEMPPRSGAGCVPKPAILNLSI